jgi:DNA adenine methylase
MKPPFTYYGGKIRLAPWIVEVMSSYEFKRYVEVFGGSGAILFAKEPSRCEVFNDLFSDVSNFYRVLRDTHQHKKLIRLMECSPYSRELFLESCRALESNKISDIERAWYFFISLRQSFSNLMNSWSTPSECSRVVAATTYQKAIDRLSEAHARLKHVHIENLDAIDSRSGSDKKWL